LLVLFSIFVLVAGTNVWLGKAGCGCSGAVEISPAWFLAIDLLAIGALVAARPESSRESTRGLAVHWNGAIAGRVVGITLIGALFVLLQTRAGRAINLITKRTKLLAVHYASFRSQLAKQAIFGEFTFQEESYAC
jgi:hypothetical protein